MRRTGHLFNNGSGSGCAVILTLVLATTDQAVAWDFAADVDAALIYTDNLFLAEAGMEQDDVVFRVAPILSWTKDGDRLVAEILYEPEALFYDKTSDADSVYHTLDASLTSTLVKDALFLYVSAVNFQSAVVPANSIPTSNIPVSANRIDSQIFEVRPYLDRNLGFANALLEGTYVGTRFDDEDVILGDFARDNDQLGGRFTLDNFDFGEGFAWGIDYWIRNVEYENLQVWEYQQASVSLGYWLGTGLRLFVLGGMESPYDNLADSSLEEGFWEAGFQYRPSQRLNLEIAAGEHSFGNVYRAEIRYELRRGITSLTYNEEPDTRGASPFDIRPLSESESFDGYLDLPGATDRFVRKRGEWTTDIETPKTNLSLRLYGESREQRTTNSGVPLADEDYAGAAIRWGWNVGNASQVSLAADVVMRDTQFANDRLRRFYVEYRYLFSSRYSVGFFAQRSEQENENEDDLFGDYTENQFGISLRAQLWQ